MALDSIGDEDFVYAAGPLHGPAMEVEDISAHGRDGNAFRRDSFKSRVTTLNAFADTTSRDAAHAKQITTYPDMKGTIVTIVQQGKSYPNMLIKDFRIVRIVPLAGAVGGVTGGNWGVYSEWDVIYAGVP